MMLSTMGPKKAAHQGILVVRQNGRADDQAFEKTRSRRGIKAETPPVVVVGSNGNGDHGADEGDHASECWDDLEEAAQDRPERRPGHADEFEPDEPENAHDERIECGCAPPIDERAAGGF
jgi:hypothetical protein